MNKKSKNEIVVIGQKIQTKIEEIDIFKLHYWKENPRVNAIIKQKYRNKDISSMRPPCFFISRNKSWTESTSSHNDFSISSSEISLFLYFCLIIAFTLGFSFQ